MAIQSEPPEGVTPYFTAESLEEALPRLHPAHIQANWCEGQWKQRGVIVLENREVLFWYSCKKGFIGIEGEGDYRQGSYGFKDTTRSPILDQGLVTVGPVTSVEDHIRYVRHTWPESFAIAVVVLVEEPVCNPSKDEKHDQNTLFCWTGARAEELLLGSWNHLEHTNSSKPAEFRLQYWYPRNDAPPWESGARLVAFLAPTHSHAAYTGTAILEATDKIVSHVRNSVRQVGD